MEELTILGIFMIIIMSFFVLIGAFIFGYWLRNKFDKESKRGILRTKKECEIIKE